MKGQNPKITKGNYSNGKEFWLVSCTIQGKRYRKKHSSKQEAIQDRARILRLEGSALNAQDFSEVERAVYELRNTSNEEAKGKSLLFAVQWFCENFVDPTGIQPIRDYYETFLSIKHAQGRREQTILEIERILGKFIGDFEFADVSRISWAEIEDWLERNSRGPSSRDRLHHMVKHFFGYLSGKSKNTPNPSPVLSKSPFEGRNIRFQDDEAGDHTNVVIFTSGECEALLKEAQKFNAQRMFVWLLFTGMRPMESVRFWDESRWRWNLISEDLRFIRVPKAVSKTRQNRVIEVNPTLRCWLELYRSHKSFMTKNWRDKYIEIRKNVLSQEKLVGDVPRHTLISMMIKDGKGWAEIELQMGNKKDVQLRHYASLITSRTEVQKFYGLVPEKFAHDISEESFRKKMKAVQCKGLVDYHRERRAKQANSSQAA